MFDWLNNKDPSPRIHDLYQFALRWTPRAIVAGIAGYYSLGIAYDKGVMSQLDRIAIKVFKHTVGYSGLGAFMPTFQWYAAWGVRITAAIVAGILYDLIERIVFFVYLKLYKIPPDQIPLHPAPINRPPPLQVLHEAPPERKTKVIEVQ